MLVTLALSIVDRAVTYSERVGM